MNQPTVQFKGSGCRDKETGWNLLAEEVSLPAAVLYQSRLQHNLNWMQRFANQQAVQLAPHGKTTMAPALFNTQLKTGAWGITLATATQTHVAFTHGVRRVLLANQLIGRQNMQLISDLIAKGLVFYCLVDSAANAQALNNFFAQQQQKISVLIEVGVKGGRCGCRSDEQVVELAQYIKTLPAVELVGIETYEGVIHGVDAEQAVYDHCLNVVALTEQLIAADLFDQEKVLLTGAGSAWYDLVSEAFKTVSNPRLETLIRPGCYLIHDHGLCYHGQQKIMARSTSVQKVGGDLQSALEIWAYVQSIPEPGSAVIGLGKRDVAFDAGLPMPEMHYRPGSSQPVAASKAWQVVSMMDQHAMMAFPPEDDLQVGDIIAFGTSHPCLTFDKWQQMCVINDHYQVVDVIRTYF